MRHCQPDVPMPVPLNYVSRVAMRRIDPASYPRTSCRRGALTFADRMRDEHDWEMHPELYAEDERRYQAAAAAWRAGELPDALVAAD
jgi:hypothetical protein